jgi:hypothetical protein
LKDLGVDGKIILKQILRQNIEEYTPNSSGSEKRPVASSCEKGDVNSGFIKKREISWPYANS